MGSEWTVTTERLDSSATVIEEKTAKYNTEWAKLYTELQNLRSAQWQGIASETFNTKLEGYRNDFSAAEKALNNYVQFLREYAARVKSVENEVKNKAGALSVGN